MLRYDKKLNCESINILPGVPRKRGTASGQTEGSAGPRAATASADDCSSGDPPQPHTTVVRPARAHPTCARGVPITVINII